MDRKTSWNQNDRLSKSSIVASRAAASPYSMDPMQVQTAALRIYDYVRGASGNNPSGGDSCRFLRVTITPESIEVHIRVEDFHSVSWELMNSRHMRCEQTTFETGIPAYRYKHYRAELIDTTGNEQTMVFMACERAD